MTETETEIRADVPKLQDALDRLTANIDRWKQENYCHIAGGVDKITESHLEAGVYHDFVLEPETVEALRSKDFEWPYVGVPVADCGTAFCVAGDVVARSGWTFVARVNDYSATTVVPTSQVNALLRGATDVDKRDVDSVARETLRLLSYEAGRLFHSENTIFDIWAIGYWISKGTLRLPDSLPETTNDFDDGIVVTPALATAHEVRVAINGALARMAHYYQDDDGEVARFVDVDMLRANDLDTTDRTSRFYVYYGDNDVLSDFITRAQAS